MKLKLQQLFKEYNIHSISYDSRTVNENDVFFAIKGETQDGNEFIEEALKKGASFVFTDNRQISPTKKVIYVEDVRSCLAIAAGIIYPALPSNIIAVTGTNGKSSVVSYVHQILSQLGKASSAMGTLGLEVNKELVSELNYKNSNQTTSDPVSFRKTLDLLKKSGIENVSFEASSHGIEQKRLGDIKVKSAAFTSFSQDHLDYHQTMENYLQAKLKLFSDNLEEGAEVVINSEILSNESVRNFFEQKNIKYSAVGREGDINVISIDSTLLGQEIIFEFKQKEYKFFTNIIGSFQAVNILIAAKLVHNLGVDFADIFGALTKLEAVRGRLQRITDPDSKFHVFVDYACTPDALQQSLNEVKKIKSPEGRLWVLFGCGGDRDAIKRPIMGKIAAQTADFVVITDDNPRTEDAEKIRDEVAMGTIYIPSEKAPRASINIVGDRRESILGTIRNLKDGDIFLLAGKGHEDYQIIGKTINKFSDIEIAQEAIRLR